MDGYGWPMKNLCLVVRLVVPRIDRLRAVGFEDRTRPSGDAALTAIEIGAHSTGCAYDIVRRICRLARLTCVCQHEAHRVTFPSVIVTDPNADKGVEGRCRVPRIDGFVIEARSLSQLLQVELIPAIPVNFEVIGQDSRIAVQLAPVGHPNVWSRNTVRTGEHAATAGHESRIGLRIHPADGNGAFAGSCVRGRISGRIHDLRGEIEGTSRGRSPSDRSCGGI